MSNQFIVDLRKFLYPVYTPPSGQGGHDIGHVRRMECMYDEIVDLIHGVGQEEYIVAVILHNLDRYEKAMGMGAESFADNYLTLSSFSRKEKERIMDAIKQHAKKEDDPCDSPLLQALRLADKWDRIGVMGATSGFAWKGNEMPAYDVDSPYGYGSTVEGQNGWKTIYQNFFRIMEWYPQFPLIRELVAREPWRFDHFLFFVRAFALEISVAHGVPNKVEDDIKKCLGKYYNDWRPTSLRRG